ncbi:MAG TPA: zf-HC2 domain-containing protein [Acidobacteriaceae bacterium]|nr:zf-HC2 domain-containing protein [Acidobacteriaceae bacterium]
MSERNPFDQKPAMAGSGPLRCEEWEELLADALDGLLPTGDRAAFDVHGAKCPVCAQLLTQAKQGREWLQFLTEEPEVPAGLLERIVGRTSGAAALDPLVLGGAAQVPAAAHALRLPVPHSMWNSRMLMTVAMAFFSIALTLNLMGVRLSDVKLSDLTPASLELNLTRQFYGAQKSLVQYYDNLRLVYEVESKVRQLRRTEEMEQPPQQEAPAKPQGNGHKNGGKLVPGVKAPPEGVLWGTPEDASTAGAPGRIGRTEQEINKPEEEAGIAVFGDGDQAGRSLA